MNEIILKGGILHFSHYACALSTIAPGNLEFGVRLYYIIKMYSEENASDFPLSHWLIGVESQAETLE